MIAQVFIDTGNLELDKPFDYSVPDTLASEIAVGQRVKVPFGGGNMPKEAYVTLLKDESDFDELKNIRSLSDKFPVLSAQAIELCFFMRKQYFCTFSEAARVMIPPGTDSRFEEWISLLRRNDEKIKLTLKQEQLIRFL